MADGRFGPTGRRAVPTAASTGDGRAHRRRRQMAENTARDRTSRTGTAPRGTARTEQVKLEGNPEGRWKRAPIHAHSLELMRLHQGIFFVHLCGKDSSTKSRKIEFLKKVFEFLTKIWPHDVIVQT